MGKKYADTRIAHVIAIHAKTAHLALALMAFQANMTNGKGTEMDDNHIVMFNHDYTKLRGQRSGKLIHAELVKIDKTFSKEALEYDTDGLYEFKMGEYYIQLVFLGDKDIPFTTYRSETPENRDKYFNHIGEMFDFVVHIKEI